MKRTWIVALLAATACDPVIQSDGDQVFQVFPFDMLRAWTYESPDKTPGYRLNAFQQEESELVGDALVHTIEFQLDCFTASEACPPGDDDFTTEGDVLFSWRMSADSFGVRFHAVDDVEFDPPVLLTRGKMKTGDTVTTESGGVTYTGTYVGREPCPAPLYWPEGDAECLRFELDDGGAGSPLAGTYWGARRVGLAAFQIELLGAERVWGLKAFDSREY